jgi:predicted secreted protein
LICQTDDVGWQELESTWETDQKQAHIRLVTAAGVTYTGLATMTSFAVDEPHDGAVSCSVSFTGSGAITKA